MHFQCDNCGTIDHIIFDDYNFGDRQLEGINFKAYIKNNQIKIDTQDQWDKNEYLKTLK